MEKQEEDTMSAQERVVNGPEEFDETSRSTEPFPEAVTVNRPRRSSFFAVVLFVLAVSAWLMVLVGIIIFGVDHGIKSLIANVHGAKEWAMTVFAGAFVILALVDHIVLIFFLVKHGFESSRDCKRQPDGPIEFCPTCGSRLVDRECPQGHTIVRCPKCSAIIWDGVCQNGCKVEYCATCNSELVDGECPRGHTITRCPDCGSILVEGVCPNGCNADPLNLGWPGGAEKKLGKFALKVIACPKSGKVGFTLRIPDSFVMGRSAVDVKEPFVELLTITRKEKAQCSRQYVRMALDPDGEAFTVTLLNSSRNPAFVDGRKIALKDETAKLQPGGRIKLNPGYELELVKATAEG